MVTFDFGVCVGNEINAIWISNHKFCNVNIIKGDVSWNSVILMYKSCLVLYDMILSAIVSWETSPTLAFGPWQERSFQLRVGGLNETFCFLVEGATKWILTSYHTFLTSHHIFFGGIFSFFFDFFIFFSYFFIFF